MPISRAGLVVSFGASFGALLGAFFGAAGCGKHDPPSRPRDLGAASPSAGRAAADGGPVAEAVDGAIAKTALGTLATVDAGPVGAAGAGDAAADLDASTEPRSLAGKTVLHCGDSMVGGPAALSKALEIKFKERGAKFVRDWQVSASVVTFDHEPRLRELLARHRPDIVILTLGANDVFVPFPQSMARHVEGIVKRIGARECYWIGPPTWKPDTGIVAVIRDHAAPCKFFDSSNMKLQRAGDGIHPTDKGGAVWGEKFWDAFNSGAFTDPQPRLDGGLDAAR